MHAENETVPARQHVDAHDRFVSLYLPAWLTGSWLEPQ